MNLANRIFTDNRTGESVKVIGSFENIAILENKQKINVETLMDPSKFTEEIDPSSFFNNQNAYNLLAEKIKSIPTDGIVDEDLATQFGGEVRPAIEESAIIMSTEDDERAELARKYGASLNNDDAVVKQQEAFSKYLEPEEMPAVPVRQQQPIDDGGPVTRIDIDDNIEVESGIPQNYAKEYQQAPQRADDPITAMFRNVKRNVDFRMNVEISNKIPRLDFIEMMEDSYEISIIDFLADEFTKNILNNPEQIKDMIKDRIKQVVYGAEVTKKKPVVEDDQTNVKKDNVGEDTKKTRKPRVKKDEVETKVKPEPPKPPKSRLLKEGREPEKPKSMQ
jgi:hypothetical protein